MSPDEQTKTFTITMRGYDFVLNDGTVRDHPRALRRYVLERWPEATIVHDYDLQYLESPEER